MKTIYIPNTCPREETIQTVESEVVKQYYKFVFLEFENQDNHNICRDIIEDIKSYYDMFLILKTSIPKDIKKVEEYFSYGIHGIYFNQEKGHYTKDEVEKMVYATKIFPSGLVFAKVEEDKETIDVLLNHKIIPKLETNNAQLIEYITQSKQYKKIYSKELIRFIPIYKDEVIYNLADKIKIKMILESINLRQKLMVKKVEESFNSSGL
ncbi:hypothetical protein EDC19_2215 [Natranaerovirga hydrolytica]|uniref:Uncharacterized protein n=1 Tax=Natranaerovirga hydrolytica TaxID=680378 RepID=A0A4R1MKC5_9FIRM|nr:hypothetical protein [Natranaerovirga hydrolytica]TCK92480.1 hypothetical protein EDC19_2215 [Natranaerovirga hydrolytica]